MLPSERLEILRRIARCEARQAADPEFGGPGWCWADHVSWRELAAEGLIVERGAGSWQYRLTDAGRMAIEQTSAVQERGGTIGGAES